MNRNVSRRLTILIAVLTCALAPSLRAWAQGGDAPVILSGAQLARIVPPGFYFEGQSAPTQMRNSGRYVSITLR